MYVDDLVIGGDDLAKIQKTKKLLFNKFKIKDLGELHYFLGIQVLRTPEGLLLTQYHYELYELNLLYKFRMTKSKSTLTPVDWNTKLTTESVELWM